MIEALMQQEIQPACLGIRLDLPTTWMYLIGSRSGRESGR
jgi:hypothetical protein